MPVKVINLRFLRSFLTIDSIVDGKHYALWVAILAAGLAWSGGFNFDYFGL